ncbi:MAG TPA: hypothetical protein DCM59_08840 [Clostridium sp.]|nr:hypothetical protein [Clostridium sp.]
MEEVTKLIERLEASTEPFVAQIKEKNIYLKTPNSRWSDKVLINEYICLQLAQKLNLTIPNGGICIVNDDTDTSDVVDDIEYDETINGVAFYSERIYNANSSINSINIVKNILNKDEINSIILFDHLIYNVDRHEGNLLISYSSKSIGFTMHIIDHSHVFNLMYNWTDASLKDLIVGEDFKDTRILDNNYNQVYRYFYELKILNEKLLRCAAEKFKKIITKKLLDEIFEGIPKVWISDDKDIQKLKEYILYRVNNIDYMVNMIFNYKRY